MLAVALTCWLTWSGSAVVLAAALLMLLAKPTNHFDTGLSLTIAGSERGLRSAVAISLSSLQRGRVPRVCLDAAGDAISSPRNAVVILKAARSGVVFEKTAGLEMSERMGRPWRPIDPDDATLRSGVRYRVGGLYFRLD